MKFPMIAILALSLAPAALAGRPEQDPVVNQIRTYFEKAAVPTAQQLKVGKVWFCREYDAEKGEFSYATRKADDRFKFQKFGKLYLNKAEGEQKQQYAFTSEGFVGTDREGAALTYIRADENGHLIAEAILNETPTEGSDLDKIKEKYALSISNNQKYVGGYLYCPKALEVIEKEDDL